MNGISACTALVAIFNVVFHIFFKLIFAKLITMLFCLQTPLICCNRIHPSLYVIQPYKANSLKHTNKQVKLFTSLAAAATAA